MVRVARLARVLRTPARTRSEKLSPGDFLCCFHSTDLFKSLSLLCNKKNQQTADFFLLIDPFDFEVLDLIGGVAVADKDRDHEHFASCIQGSEGIFHIGSPCPVGNFEGTRSV